MTRQSRLNESLDAGGLLAHRHLRTTVSQTDVVTEKPTHPIAEIF